MSSVLPWMRALAQLAHHLPPAHVATTPWGRAISQLAAALPHIPQGDQPRALDRADDDDDRRFASCYHHTVKTAAQSKNWQLALRCARLLEDLGSGGDVVAWNSVLSAYGRAGQWARALELLARMRESASLPNPNTRSCATVINALAKARVWQRACGLLEDMYVGEDSEERTPPDTICVNAAITACARVGQWQRALNLLHNHRAREIVDVISYNAALNACERAAEWQQALSLLATMARQRTKAVAIRRPLLPM
eukprot:GEMP01038231.1.p1 GENE.GEMP01038231.1~~GEMP01038231.1.p1  ORF type:complete len:253 (+),score=69.35 GEMP01038231.1:139-897(+)